VYESVRRPRVEGLSIYDGLITYVERYTKEESGLATMCLLD
jgi:hypothetical protein